MSRQTVDVRHPHSCIRAEMRSWALCVFVRVCKYVRGSDRAGVCASVYSLWTIGKHVSVYTYIILSCHIKSVHSVLLIQ